MIAELVRTEDIDPDGGKFDGQCDAVKASADFADDGCILVGEPEIRVRKMSRGR